MIKRLIKIQEVQTGRVFVYKGHAFVAIKPIDSEMKCSDCGQAIWNVSNFACPVHFCINKVYEFEMTDWVANKTN